MSKHDKGTKEKKVGINIDEAVRLYSDLKGTYESLASKVTDIIKDVLKNQKIEYYNVSYRVKKLDSFKKKASKNRYKNPLKEIKDFAGIRIITYVESEATKAADIVENLFEIDFEHSIDKSKTLGTDKVGYRSIHYIARLTPSRCKLPEFEKFSNLEFEIQIRSILEHAWAEIEHDRNYKFTGILPEEIQRRFAILAGVLELADREFDQISMAIDSYKSDVAEKTKEGDLDIEINTTALREFLTSKFEYAIATGMKPVFGPKDDGASEAVEELNKFGIKNLRELDRIIPNDLEKKIIELNVSKEENFIGLIRTIMMLKDANKYFEKNWDIILWDSMDPKDLTLFQFYRINIKEILDGYNISYD